MARAQPIIIIEDDADDRLLFSEVFQALGYRNELMFFGDGQEAISHLETCAESPFLIICDVNLPRMNGFEIKNRIHGDDRLKKKCAPFIFLTTASSPQAVNDAYCLSIQGFFVKPTSIGDLQKLIKKIMEYWQTSETPNNG